MTAMTGAAVVGLLFGTGALLGLWMPGKLLRTVSGSLKSQGIPETDVLGRLPFPVWVESGGRVTWRNRACEEVFAKKNNEFSGKADFRQRGGERGQRDSLHIYKGLGEADDTAAYHLHGQDSEGRLIYFAQDATAEVEARRELNRLIQTLTSTFANLPTGLAVFDRKRDLILFNPALGNLLELAPEWLARRPSLRAFLDRLRNDGAIPEPKDYTSLRDEFSKLEDGAFDGHYQAEWMLPNGRLYKVTGHPYEQGGAALLFEDISRAAAIEADYRAEVRQLHAALENLTDAVAIFNQAGEMTYANTAFDTLWQTDISQALTPVTAAEASQIWREACDPSPAWGEFRDFVHNLMERSEWQADIRLKTGVDLTMTVVPIAEGHVMAEFRTQP